MYGPVAITVPGCPISVAAGRVRSVGDGEAPAYFVSGWGADFEDAAQGCRFEADETFFAQIEPQGRIVHAKADALSGDVLLPPTLMLFSDAQYRSRAWSSVVGAVNNVPARWRRTGALHWIFGEPLLGHSGAWVPVRHCLLAYPKDADCGIPAAHSAGLAVGKRFEDACIRAFLELVERDATAIWWYNRLVLPRLEVLCVEAPMVRSYDAWTVANRRELRLLRLALDLPFPTVAAISFDRDGHRPAMGFATDLTIDGAARRAVGELAQCEANLRLLQASAERLGTEDFTAGALQLYRWHRQTCVYDHPHLQGRPSTEPMIDASMDWATGLVVAQSHGFQAFAVDLTGHDGPPLARVVVPGLRSTKPRFAPGRLFDVPRALGLRPAEARRMAEWHFPL